MMSLRVAVALIRRSEPSRKLIKTRVGRRYLGTMALREEGHDVIPMPRATITKSNVLTSNNHSAREQEVKIDESERSATISWAMPDNENNQEAFPKDVLEMEKAMRESFPSVTTTRPFFVLEGSGRRVALLSVIPL